MTDPFAGDGVMLDADDPFVPTASAEDLPAWRNIARYQPYACSIFPSDSSLAPSAVANSWKMRRLTTTTKTLGFISDRS